MENELRGVRFGANGPHVTHLLFADDSIVFLEATDSSVQTLRRILHDYELSSGQRVNLQKSSIFFGPGSSEDLRQKLKGDIGITCEALSERYLGLPTVVGRAKEGCFKYLTERSWGKVKGWKGQGMSKEGKCILIKSVLQAVPAYAMSCFQLTKKQCKQLSSVSSNFWWGDSEGRKKVHWIGWDRMCKSKQAGGMGFRDYGCFNQAFLAKQGWRLLTDPDSLCSKVLKGRYFRDGEFLDASCPKRASFTWKGIIHGRDLLKEGLVWRIGDGSQVRVWNDNWIPRTGAKYPLGSLLEDKPERVQDFIVHGGGAWDEDELRKHLLPIDVQDILRTPIGRPGSSDFQAWNYTKNGMFSVKSAYHLAIQRKRAARGRAETSRNCDEHRGWLALWGTQVPGKVKVHCFRLIENGLAVGTELSHRKIKDGITCLVCGRNEDLVHRFWSCPHSQSVWSFASARSQCSFEVPPKRLRCHSELKGWLLDWIGKATDDHRAWFMMTSYNIWQARNDARESQLIADPNSVVLKTAAALEEWKEANKTCSQVAGAKPSEHWLRPEPGWVKVNADGAYHSAEGIGGGGVVLRDHHGNFVSGASHFFPHLIDAEHAELLACQQGLVLARNRRILKVVLETDCTGVAAKLRRDEQDRSIHGPLVAQIKSLMQGFGDISVQVVRRSANGAAHILAKEGCDNKICMVWNVTPEFVRKNIVLDSVMS